MAIDIKNSSADRTMSRLKLYQTSSKIPILSPYFMGHCLRTDGFASMWNAPMNPHACLAPRQAAGDILVYFKLHEVERQRWNRVVTKIDSPHIRQIIAMKPVDSFQ